MLTLFRRKQKSLRWVLWVVILILAGGMLLLFVDTPSGITGAPSAYEVARVCDKPISALEFRRQYSQLYDMYRQIYKLDQQDPNVVRQLGIEQQALNGLLSDYALWCEAERLGIQASPEEIREEIFTFQGFQDNGRFIGVERYQQVLSANDMTPQQFEASVGRQIVRRKVENVLTDGIAATPDEVRQEYINRNQEVKVRYVAVDPQAVLPAQVPEEQLSEYFKNNQDAFKAGEQRQVSFVYVTVDPETVQVTDQQIQTALGEAPQEEQVRASHILISSRQIRDEQAALIRARDVLAQLKAGADFAETARQYSDDPASAVQGGDLGFFGRGQMVPEFEQTAFSLEPGTLSDLVKTDYGYHIIKVTNSPKGQADPRRAFAEFQARRNEADRQASEKAAQLAEQARGESLEAAAQKLSLEVEKSDFFGLADTAESLPVRPDFNQKVFALTQGQIAEPYHTGVGYLVARLDEIRPAAAPAFEEVKDKVLEQYRTTQGETLAREKAESLAREARTTGKTFDQVAAEMNLQPAVTGFFKKGSTIDDVLKFSPQVHDQAFRMKAGDVSTAIPVAGKFIVFQLMEATPIDDQKLELERSKIAEEVNQQKRSTFFQNYIQNLLDQLRKDDKIKVNQELVRQVVG